MNSLTDPQGFLGKFRVNSRLCQQAAYAKAESPVMSRPTISFWIDSVPS